MKQFYFLLLAILCGSVVNAQSPGGVSSNLTMWIRADQSTSQSDSLDSWGYFGNTSASGSFANTVGNGRPFLQPSTLNFQPTILFNGAEFMDGPTGAGAPITAGNAAYSIFGVWSSSVLNTTSDQYQRVWSQKGTGGGNADGASIWILDFPSGAPTIFAYGDQAEITPFTQGAVQPYTANTWYTSELNLLSPATSSPDLQVFDQTNLASGTPTTGTTGNAGIPQYRSISNAVNRLGANAPGSFPGDAEFLNGNVAEVIVYNGNVTGTQANQVFSYLGLKYGIHMGISLLSSAGTTIWDAVANSAYNNAVFGIGLDNTSGLNLAQSNSILTGSGNGTGQSGMGNLVLSSTAALGTDQSFTIIGNNNGALTESTITEPAVASGSEMLGRLWKVAATGSVGTTNLTVDLTGLTVTGTVATDFRLVIDQDGDGNFGTGTQTFVTPTSYAGNILTFNGLTLNNNVVFGVITNAAPGTPLPVTWTSFTATADGNNVDLNWGVAANATAKVYEVEHSIDGVGFSPIGSVNNEVNVQNYSFVHVNAGPGTHYYRIHEVDIDGKDIYSKVVSVIINSTDFSLRVYNNPVVGNTNAVLELNAVKGGTANIEVWTVSGTRINMQQQAVGIGSNTIPVTLGSQTATSYVVKVQVNGGPTQTVQIVRL